MSSNVSYLIVLQRGLGNNCDVSLHVVIIANSNMHKMWELGYCEIVASPIGSYKNKYLFYHFKMQALHAKQGFIYTAVATHYEYYEYILLYNKWS